MRAVNEASTSAELVNTVLRRRAEVALDLVAAVKGLHELSSEQLIKLIKDSGNTVVRHIAEDGSQIQIDLEKFARSLPLHLIAVLMAWEKDKSTFKYLLCGILLLHSMCDVASRVPKIERILLDDVRVSEQLINLVFYLLVLLGAFKLDNHDIPNDMVLLHSALVACTLKLFSVIVSTQFQDVTQVLIAYSKVDTFMDATVSAVCTDVKFLHAKLSTNQMESSINTSPSAEETLNHLFQQCDSSLQFLQSLCQQKMFRECIVKNKELCRNGGVLLLVRSVLNLKVSSSYNMSSLYMTSVSRLKAKALSLILHLCEADNVSYLDEIASNPRSQNLAESIVLQVIEMLKKMFGIDSEESTTSSKTIYPKGQLELNAMRLADVFSDDSNFRSFIMIKFTEVLSAIFLLPHLEFLSGWCSSDLPACEDDATLDVPRASYAHQRTSLLIKVIANLHCFVPDVCQDEKNHFVLMLVRFLQKELPAFDAERSATVSKNLSSLLGHAESLVPRFLNEDDVQLLRLFINQFESLNTSAASGDRVRDARNTEGCSSEVGNNGINMEEDTRGNVASKEANQLNIGTNVKLQTLDREMKLGIVEQGKGNGSATYMRETERDARIVETSGSDSSPKNSLDQIKGGGFEESQEDEKVDAIHSDEKQQRKRKRTVMNDKQIALIESAIVDEPDMHRNAHALRSWADKLSLHGAEVTTSRLKNWLNNRKARLARAAKDVRVSYEGETGHLDSPPSPMDDGRISSSVRGTVRTEVIDSTLNSSVDFDMGTTLAATQEIARSAIFFEPGQNVIIVDEKKEEVGKGKVYQVHGKWLGRIVEQSGMCVVDILELFVDRFTRVLHPMDYTGNTFDQAEKRLGSMRVLWDLNKMIKLPPR